MGSEEEYYNSNSLEMNCVQVQVLRLGWSPHGDEDTRQSEILSAEEGAEAQETFSRTPGGVALRFEGQGHLKNPPLRDMAGFPILTSNLSLHAIA